MRETLSRFILITALLTVSSPWLILPATFAAPLPLPPNGFPNPGFPKYIESGWAEINNPRLEAQISLFYNSQAVVQILDNDGVLYTQMMNITSYECLDDNTYRYIANQVIYPKKTSATICVTEFANATHRVSAVLPSGEKGCPESPFASPDGVNADTTTHSIFLRQEGVLPEPLETKCINQPNPYIPPRDPIPKRNQSQPSISDMPYARTYGAPVASGLWKSKDLLVLENERFYAAAAITPPPKIPSNTSTNTTTEKRTGTLYSAVGEFFSHDCLSPTNFVSTSMVSRIFDNGFIDYGTACQNGTRTNSTSQDQMTFFLNVDYNQGPNCTIYSAPEATDPLTTVKYSLEMIQPLSSNPSTECISAQEAEPDTNPPTSASARVDGMRVFPLFSCFILGLFDTFFY